MKNPITATYENGVFRPMVPLDLPERVQVRIIVQPLYTSKALSVKDQPFTLKPPRTGWDEQFARMGEYGDDKLLDNPTPTKWDETEWEW
jgi:predicted DNA-binding antitoxin AbrB/MazE fold protein